MARLIPGACLAACHGLPAGPSIFSPAQHSPASLRPVHHMTVASIDHESSRVPNGCCIFALLNRCAHSLSFFGAHQGGCAIPSNDPQLTARPATCVSKKGLLRLLWQQQCLGLFFVELIKGTSTQLPRREAIYTAIPLEGYASSPTAIHSGLVPAPTRARSRSQRCSRSGVLHSLLTDRAHEPTVEMGPVVG